jgi:hypothetical protein
MSHKKQKNIYGLDIEECCQHPITGFYRDGFCHTDERDQGVHTVCCVMTSEFLAMSRYLGNDLSTPRPEYHFPGLSPGDRWCLCAQRWLEAYENDCAPKVILEATHLKSLEIIPLDLLEQEAWTQPS